MNIKSACATVTGAVALSLISAWAGAWASSEHSLSAHVFHPAECEPCVTEIRDGLASEEALLEAVNTLRENDQQIVTGINAYIKRASSSSVRSSSSH